MPIFSSRNEIYDVLDKVASKKIDYKCKQPEEDTNVYLDLTCYEGKLLKYIIKSILKNKSRNNNLYKDNNFNIKPIKDIITNIIEGCDNVMNSKDISGTNVDNCNTDKVETLQQGGVLLLVLYPSFVLIYIIVNVIIIIFTLAITGVGLLYDAITNHNKVNYIDKIKKLNSNEKLQFKLMLKYIKDNLKNINTKINNIDTIPISNICVNGQTITIKKKKVRKHKKCTDNKVTYKCDEKTYIIPYNSIKQIFKELDKQIDN